MHKYSIARMVDEEREEWLLSESRNFTDEPEDALMFDCIEQLPTIQDGEYPVKMIFDEQGKWVHRIEMA